MKTPINKSKEFFDFPIPIVSFDLAKLCKDRQIYNLMPPTSNLTKYYTQNGKIIYLGRTGRTNLHTCYNAPTITDVIDYIRWLYDINIVGYYFKNDLTNKIHLASTHINGTIDTDTLVFRIDDYNKRIYYKLLNYYLFLILHPDKNYTTNIITALNKIDNILNKIIIQKTNAITAFKNIILKEFPDTIVTDADKYIHIVYKNVLIIYKSVFNQYFLDSIHFHY